MGAAGPQLDLVGRTHHIAHVLCWVLPRLEELVHHVSEGALSEAVLRHLREAHLSELEEDHVQKEKMATVWEHTTGREVVGLEGPLPPGAEGPCSAGRFSDHLDQQLPRLVLSSSASFSAWPDWTSSNCLCTSSSILPTTGNTQGPSAALLSIWIHSLAEAHLTAGQSKMLTLHQAFKRDVSKHMGLLAVCETSSPSVVSPQHLVEQSSA